MNDYITTAIIAIPILYIVHRLIEVRLRHKIYESTQYIPIIWDNFEEFYVVMDKQTHKQYIIDTTILGIKLSETVIDWRNMK